MLNFFKIFRVEKNERSERSENTLVIKTLDVEMNDFVKEYLRSKTREEIDDFMYKEHHILYEIEEYDEELSYLLKQTSDIYNYTYQAPEVKKYLSTILCKCLFLKKKEIKSKHWLSYVLK
jgi:hypothetical protein